MSRPPNILLLVTDQQRPDTVGGLAGTAAAGLLSGLARTPVLDRLCRGGTAFVRAYTPGPVCVAARAALFTGRPPHATGCVDNNHPVPAGEPSLMHRLGELGYRSHGVGKMHFCPDPYALWGFDSRDTSEEMPGPDDDYMAFLREVGFGHVREPHGVRSESYYTPQPSQLPERLHHTRWVADQSLAFLERRDRRRPFFLAASFIKPHPPFENPLPWAKLFRAGDMPGPDVRPGDAFRRTHWNRVQNRYKWCDAGEDQWLAKQRQAQYLASISHIDHEVGRILAGLGEGLDDTLVLFCSDHGELLGDYGCVGKRSMAEPSARVPLIARLPGRVPAGVLCQTPASLIDVVPTCLAAAGGEGDVHPDGTDLATLAGRPGDGRIVTSQFQHGRYGLYMAADADLKLVYSAADGREWLLRRRDGTLREDVVNDPAAAERLRGELFRRFEAEGYDTAHDAGGWTEYERPTLPDDPAAGLLRQDVPEAEADLATIPPEYRPPRRVPSACDGVALLACPDPFRRPNLNGRSRPMQVVV